MVLKVMFCLIHLILNKIVCKVVYNLKKKNVNYNIRFDIIPQK